MWGQLIAFEGIDRTGKTTQSKLLIEQLNNNGIRSELIRFPDRSTVFGGQIDKFLKSQVNFEDRMIHILFILNWWELKQKIEEKLNTGVNIILDRYSYSGMAYTAAKGIDVDWCIETEKGLPKPDFVYYLYFDDLSKMEKRGGYGEERYEKLDFQKKVKNVYEQKLTGEEWVQIDADQNMEQIQKFIQEDTLARLKAPQTELKYF